MFKELERQDDWLTQASLDLTQFRLKFQYYPNRAYMSEERIWGWWLWQSE